MAGVAAAEAAGAVVAGVAAAVSAAGVVVVAVAAGVVEAAASVVEVLVDGVPVEAVPVAVVPVVSVLPACVPPAVVSVAAVSVAAALVVGVLAVEASEAGVVLPAAVAFGVVFSLPDAVLEGLLDRTGVSAFCVSWAGCPASSDPLPPQAARDSIISSARGRPG